MLLADPCSSRWTIRDNILVLWLLELLSDSPMDTPNIQAALLDAGRFYFVTKKSSKSFQERFALMMCSREMSSERATNGPCAKEAYFFERCQTYKSDTDVCSCFSIQFLPFFRCTETQKLSTPTSISAIWEISTTRKLSRTISVGTSSAFLAKKAAFLIQTTSPSVTSKTKIKNKLLSFCSTLIYLQLLDSWKYKNETII